MLLIPLNLFIFNYLWLVLFCIYRKLKKLAGLFGDILVTILACLPVVSWPYITAALIPMPCCPLDCFNLWNLLPYNSFAKILPRF